MPESGLVLVGRGAESILEQELWRKLAVGEGVAPVVQGLVGASASEFAEFRAAAPPSLAAGFRLWTDPAWAALLAEESPARALAWSPATDLAMIGPATEEAWDRMLAAIRGG